MAIFKVQKRNGSIDDFDEKKIYNAIKKAIVASGSSDFSDINRMVKDIIILLEKRRISIPDVETIQDTVEFLLIKESHNIVAQKYISYRKQRSILREDQQVVVEVEKTMKEYLSKADRRVNANANSGYSL